MIVRFNRTIFTDAAVAHAISEYKISLHLMPYYGNNERRPKWENLPDIKKYHLCKRAGEDLLKDQVNNCK